MANHTLCWECGKACTKGCSWSAEFIPVKGWDAEETHIDSMPEPSYYVKECPEFVRDSYQHGRYRPEEYVAHLEKTIADLREEIQSLKKKLEVK